MNEKNIQNLSEELYQNSLKEIATFLKSPQFTDLKDFYLSEVEKQINTSNELYQLRLQLLSTGASKDTINISYNNLYKSIDEADNFNTEQQDFLKRYFTILHNASIKAIEQNSIITIPYTLCNDAAKTPIYAHFNDSGMDLYATQDYTINPGQTVLVSTGVKVAIPEGYELQVRPKSGRSLKTKYRVANTPGTIKVA